MGREERFAGAEFRTSNYAQPSDACCAEVALGEAVGVRDSKDPDGPAGRTARAQQGGRKWVAGGPGRSDGSIWWTPAAALGRPAGMRWRRAGTEAGRGFPVFRIRGQGPLHIQQGISRQRRSWRRHGRDPSGAP
ncbi:DUF397 domain-containing protein [Streptomyces bohaiensis]|uniref:DUF397 domain-containing protein n=1 Tax=Streptomyces bohaiensis TaxID=1431344 RepID=A0ABX1C9W7_9ACTN|nr:DUF397 domain-containing protein [Streptomyces bohaiensis]